MPGRLYVFFILIITSFLPLSALPDQKKFGIEQGISSNYVVSAAQDKRGFLWFATESGLNRFDGIKFKIYKRDKQRSTISGNELNKVYADKYEDVVWIATQREGLNRFDCRTERFTEFKHDPKNAKSIITNDITDIVNAENGNLWLSTYHRGVEYYDKANNSFQHFNRSTIRGMVSENVWCINPYRKDFLLIGHVNAGLSVLNLKTKAIVNYRSKPADALSIPGNEVLSVFTDKAGNIWVGTNKGLALFNFTTGKFTRISAVSGGLTLQDKVYALRQLEDGRILVGTETIGVFALRYKPDEGDLSLESISMEGRDEDFASPSVRAILQDSFRNIWICTYGEGVKLITSRPELFHRWSYSPLQSRKDVLSNPVAWGITTDVNGGIWVGTDGGGINVFNNEKRERLISKSQGLIADNAVLSAIRDSRDNLWFGTFRGGVSIIGPRNSQTMSFGANGIDADIRCFYEDGDQNMWIGSSNGLYRYNLERKDVKQFTTANSTLPGNLVRALAKDEHGRLWVGFFGQGLAIFDKQMKRMKVFDTYSGFPSNTINHIFRDRNGTMWVATGEGLVRFGTNLKYRIYNERSGLANGHVRAIVQDKQGYIWFSSLAGISRLIPGTNKVFNYDHHYGVPMGDFKSGSVTSDSKGNLYFGSENGLCYFNPALIPSLIQLPSVTVTGFRVYTEKSKVLGDFTDIPVKSKIRLNYNQNTFNVSFNTLDYSLNRLIEYSYKLKGLNDSWYHVNEENSVTFRNIPPGNYQLQIRAKVKNQEWDSKVTSVQILISPPFWLSWWAKAIYAFIVIIIGFIIVRFYKRELELENSLLLEKINNRQEQELHDERVRFFTNITHELRTPLTLILGPLEDMQDAGGLSEKHLSKVSIIHKSTSRLLTLVNQLLEFQKTESQSKQLHVQRGSMVQLMYEIGLKYRELNTNKSISFEFENQLEDEIMYFDPDVMASIAENLLSNAFKYTSQGVIRLSLKGYIENDIRYTEIEVSDTGKGIPQDALSKIFERYYQVNEDKHISGTGIGLALVKNLVKIHEGTITVKSELGAGSTFMVRISADNTYPLAEHRQAVSPLVQLNPAANEHQEGRFSVLVIDDNIEIVQYIVSALSGDYSIYTADNGRDGLDQAYQHMPDLIVSDVMMPEMNGFELSRQLKQDVRTSHIPIILLTARDSSEDRKEGYSIGVESYLTKPFSANLLRSRISNLLEYKRKLAESIAKNATAKDPELLHTLNVVDNEFIKKITAIIEQNIGSEEVDVVFLADKMDMSHSTLYRKIKALMGISVNEFIRKVRINHAARLLHGGSFTISEISYMVGINSVTYFRQCFKEEFGMTPSEYLKKSAGSKPAVE